jgi:alkylated DNA repair dioxygenase AlkB
MLEPIELPDADVSYDRRFLEPEAADELLAALLSDIDWDHHVIRMFGREVPTPRRSAWFGDPEARYTYSGLTLEPRPWPELLLAVRSRVERACRTCFNAVLANLYRDGRDSMGWHADDEPELGDEPSIASLSLGAERRFTMRHAHRPETDRLALDLGHGSLLLMAGTTQRHWRHALPKTRRSVGPRINLTFRFVLAP